MSLDVQGSKTLREMIDELKDKHKIVVNMIVQGRAPLWSEGSKTQEHRLDMKVEDAYLEASKLDKFWPGKKYLTFVVSAETVDGDEASCPIIRYILN